MFFRLVFVFLLISGSILLAPMSDSAVILKAKGDQALIDLEGLKIQKGAYFSTIDRYGNKKGILQITRVGHKKAIGVLKGGRMAKRWSVEPTSEKKALMAQMKFEKRMKKIARIKAAKLKKQMRLAKKKQKVLQRRLAMKEKREKRQAQRQRAEERRVRAHKRRLALNKKRRKERERRELYWREIASLPEEEGLDMAEQGEDVNWQSPPPNEEETLPSNYDLNFSIDKQQAVVQQEEESPSESISPTDNKTSIGLTPSFEYNFLKANLRDDEEGFLMLGLGGGLRAFVDFYLNSFLRAESSLGFRRFSVSSENSSCYYGDDDYDECSLKINYLSLGLSLKLNTGQIGGKHKIWLAANGELMYGLDKFNTSLIDEISFDPPIHGTLGAGIGIDIYPTDSQEWFIPIAIKGDMYMPPSASVLHGSAGIQIGFSYNL